MSSQKDIYGGSPTRRKQKSGRRRRSKVDRPAERSGSQQYIAGGVKVPTKEGGRRRHKKRRSHSIDAIRSRQETVRKAIVRSIFGIIFLYALGVSLFALNAQRDHQKRIDESRFPAVPTTSTNGNREADARIFINQVDRFSSQEKTIQELLDKGLTDQAITQLLELQEENPHSLYVLNTLGRIFMQSKQYQQAVTALQRSLVIEPDHYENRLLLARAHLALQQFFNAIEVGSWAARINPSAIAPQDVISTAAMQLSDPGRAIPHLKKILEKQPENVEAQTKLAVAYRNTGQNKEAIDLLNALREKDTRESLVYFYLSASYAEQGLVIKAVDVLIEASHRFDKRFILNWISGTEYDAIRETPEFRRFYSRLQQQRNDSVNMRSEHEAPVRTEVDLLENVINPKAMDINQ